MSPTTELKIHATFLPKISLAHYQNAIPLLLEFAVSNQTTQNYQALQLKLESMPALLMAKTWQIEQLEVGQTRVLNDTDVLLDVAALQRLNEAEMVQLTLTLCRGETVLNSEIRQLEFLPRNQWTGLLHMPEMLAAHVLPNEQAVAGVLKQAAQLLTEQGSALVGYQAGMKRAWEQASAIWSVLGGLGWDYVVPPASFEHSGQKIRTPSQIMESGLATCLDSTLFCCALLEQCGLHPVVVLTSGHAFAGVWLKDECFATALMDDVSAIRKRLALQELILFETTWLTHKPVPGFAKAVEQGAKLVAEAVESEFELLIDIHRARLLRIKPLANGEANVAVTSANVSQTAPAFEAAPDLPESELYHELAHTPSSRLELWQRKLLDLSLRNNLLNFKPAKRAIKLDAPDPAELEDKLTDGTTLRLKVRPSLMQGQDQRDLKLFEARHHEDVLKQQAQDALQRGDVLAVVENEQELTERLTELYRCAKADLSEGGANTLFLALGFLSWCQDEDEGRFYRAPLVLLPVVLTRKSVREGFTLTLHDDEARFNPTLLQLLRQDFGLELPINPLALPKDEHGLDVRSIWRQVSQGVKDIKGWEVVEEAMLSTFSFAKYLMWKDLVDRTEQLKQNAVVRHLIETPRDPFPNNVAFPEPDKLDQEFSPQQTFCPLASDSSQLSAVMAASKGKDFVLIGPPGTGKSQTIANLIAQTLASGKTVLFVSEKVAALEVVYRRLRDVGLGEFCLELHSSKARKLDVLQQLGRAWDAKGQDNSAEWAREAERLKQLRDQLNAFVQQQHLPRGNGLTAYRAIGQILLGKSYPALGLTWQSVDQHDVQALDQLRELAERLDVNARAVGEIAHSPLHWVEQQNWSPNWQQALLSQAQQMITHCQSLQQRATEAFTVLGLPVFSLNQTTRQGLAVLMQTLPQAYGYDWGFVLRPDARRILEQLGQGISLVQQYQQLFASLSAPYREQVLALNIVELRQQWQQACEKFWPLSWFAQRKIKQTLAAYVTGQAELAVATDLEKLQQLQTLQQQIQQQSVLTDKTQGLWSGLQTKLDEVARLQQFQQQLQLAISQLAHDADSLAQLQAALEKLLGSGNALLESHGKFVTTGQAWKIALDAFDQGMASLLELGASQCAMADVLPDSLAQHCQQLLNSSTKLHAWCAWRKVRFEADEHGLLPLVLGMEQGTVALGQVRAAFETDYCRWWLNQLVEQDAVLRTFVAVEHEKRIADFCAVDERFTALTRCYIHAQLCARLPAQDDVGKNSEWGVLRRELQKKRAHKPLRELISLMPTTLTKLTPCLLMSPLSIAQYLSADTAMFDLVVFDEASQIPVWDAIGAIARGKQVVMVGDPKQLPPTAFFNRASSEEVQAEDIETDLESILDECIGANLPTLNLSWHYRSRHESLIAFSNHRYYGGGLVTFPSPVTSDRAVSLVKVSDGIYEKGGSRTNKPEAQALVAELLNKLRDPLFQASGFTIGVVTFNSEQQRLIEDLLDAARREYPEIEPHFSEDALEPVFVKNLESVQGDERDIMYFSIGYGPDAQGRVSMNFGPMNKDGGERRLNVAITRARQQLRVFSSLGADAIDLSRTQAKGVHDLKRFLEFAERGAVALSVAANQTQHSQSGFEQAVAQALRSRGWVVQPQIGVSAAPIPLGIVDPANPERYLAGIECDGPSYLRNPTSRDRDKLREQVLHGLGWQIIRIWAHDWWLDEVGALDKLCAELALLQKKTLQ